VTKTRQLLVVGKQPETGEVLKAVLERQQTEVTSVRTWQHVNRAAMRSDGTVLVVHADQDLPEHPEADPLRKLPRVVIGRAQIPSESAEEQSRETTRPGGADNPAECCLDEIFEYRDLFQAIETLWNRAS